MATRKILFRGQTRHKGEKTSISGKPLPGIWVTGGIFPQNKGYERAIIYTQDPKVEKHVVCVFKKNSPMNKRWHEEVTSHINPYSLTASKWWFMDFPYCGKCQIAMWDDGCGNVYGYYSTQAAHHNSGKLPDYVQPIKMSEYYIAQERCKELDSLLSEAVDKGSRASHIGSYKATFKKTSDGSDGTGFEDSTSVCFSVEHCAMPSNTRTAIVGLLHDYCLKNQRSLDDLTEFEYLGPAEKADSPA